MMEVVCETGKVEALATQASYMEKELENWQKKVKDFRAQYYELNYFSTLQLIVLRRDLGVLKSSRASSSAVSPTVLALLQSVSPSVTRDEVLRAVRDIASMPVESQNPSTLETISVSIQHTNTSQINEEHQDVMNADSSSQRGKANESTRNHCTVIGDNLSEEQKEILMYVVDRFGFPKQLVLKAFEECKGDVNKYDIQNWCLENAEKYQFQDEDSDDETSNVVSVVEDPQSSRPTGTATNILSWVSHSLLQYITPQKGHKVFAAEQCSPQSPSRLAT